MLRSGCIVLSVWGGVHFIASALSLVVSVLGKYAPMMKMVFTDNEIAMYDARIFSVTKALAIMHNTGAAVLGALFLIITWIGLSNGHKWAFWTLLFAGLFVQAMWFLSDSIVGNRTIAVNSALSVLFLSGMAISGYGLFKLAGY